MINYYTHKNILEKLKLLVKETGNQKALALKMGISEQYLSDILKEKRDPGAAVLKFLGVERVIMYQEVK